jgi:diacylglycerol O-acyltransferase / wax synthase
MKNGPNGNHLSWGDALFLYLERAGMPLNIASVSIFDGPISFEACLRSIESKLTLLPRYQQRIVVPPLDIGFPSWEQDPEFDIRNHVREVILQRGTERELKSVTSKIFSSVMNRQRPLWDLTLVQGLRENRTALVTRVHHCLADGIAGIGLMATLLDASREPQRIARKKQRHAESQPRSSWAKLLDGWIASLSDVVQRMLAAQGDVLSFSERLLASGDWPLHEFNRFWPELTAPTERLFFNKIYQGPQRFAWSQIPLAKLKAIRHQCGATLNDVILALMTSTIQRYSELHGERVKGRLFRMMVPVSVRSSERQEELGNCISLLPVTIPLGIRDPRKLLAAVHERTDFLKRAHIAELVGLMGGMAGAAPAPLQALVGPIASLLPVTPFNLVCTNVRGPEAPLYLLGRKMVDWYPYVPVGGEMSLNCAILSYNGTTYFGFSGDVHAAPHLESLESLLQTSLRELQSAIRVKRSISRRASRKPRMSARSKRIPSGSRAVPVEVGGEPIAAPAEDEMPLPVAAD